MCKISGTNCVQPCQKHYLRVTPFACSGLWDWHLGFGGLGSGLGVGPEIMLQPGFRAEDVMCKLIWTAMISTAAHTTPPCLTP